MARTTTLIASKSRSRLHSLRHRLGGAALAAALLATPDAGAGEPPNLQAATVSGPGQVNVDSNVLATVRIENAGGPLVGEYTAYVVLSADLVIDDTDPKVATITDTFFGAQSILCSIPETIPDVQHVWGLLIEPAAGETELEDNWNVGQLVDVLFTDMQLEDPTPVEAFARVSEDPLLPIPVRVINVGTPESIVVFTTSLLTPAPWLEVDSPSSFAVGGQPGNDVFLNFDHTGLVPGSYTTTVKFQNIYHESDTEELEVTLTVGPAFFQPGHRIFGQIATEGDIDELEFDAVAGMRLLLKVHNSTGTLSTKITVLDEEGEVEVSKVFKHSKDDIKKALKLKTSGRKLMRIESAKGYGQYSIKTKRKLPKKARAHVVKIKGLASGASHEAEALLLPGGKLDFAADPNAAFAGALWFGLSGPNGEVFDMSGALSDPSGGLSIEGIEAEEMTGSFKITVGGFGGGANEKVKLRILPWQPGPAKGKIYLN